MQRFCSVLLQVTVCSFRQAGGGREGGGQVATSITAFCFLLHLSHSLALPPLCSFIAFASPSTPRLHTGKKSITLRSECWRRHRLLCPADWPFPACSVGRRAAGFSARFVSAGHFSHFWTSGDAQRTHVSVDYVRTGGPPDCGWKTVAEMHTS